MVGDGDERRPRLATAVLVIAAALGWLAPFLWEGYWMAGVLVSWCFAAVPMLAAAALSAALHPRGSAA